MALPRLDAPTYEITLPVSNKRLKFRPFLVKEQKILLMAMESGESDVIEANIHQVLNNCAISEIDIDSMPIVDIEYYFLNLRARSVGESVESKYKCENIVEGKECGNTMDVEFNILDTNVKLPEVKDEMIPLTDTVGIKMKYPDYAVIHRMKHADSVTDVAFELVIDCIDYIYDEDNVYHAHETPKDELMAFLETLTKDQFAKLEDFIDNLPKLEKKIEVTCKKCGFTHKIDVQGLEDFFG
jgi:hypothetical protein